MLIRIIRSPNLLVDANWTIKIADFGLSCAKSQITDDVQISLLWTAPEILMREKNCYSEKSDVYRYSSLLSFFSATLLFILLLPLLFSPAYVLAVWVSFSGN